MLKNIPGVEVSSDGGIKVNGKAIDKLLIEGDDLFDDRYRLLSKNLDVDVVKDVQILNNFEDNPVIKNFQESEKVALNLRLREDKKNVFFGNFQIGFGTNEQYDNSLNLGLLNKKIKFFNLAGLNNVGVKSVSQVNNSKSEISEIKAQRHFEKTNNEIVNIDNLNSSNFSKNEDVFNTSFLNSLSLTTDIFNKIKLRSLSNIAYDDIDKQHSSFSEYFIDPQSITYSENNNLTIKDIIFSTELELKYFNKNNTYYTYNFTFEGITSKKTNDLLLDNSPIFQKQKDNEHNFFNHFNITKKVSKKELLLLYAYLGINNTKQKIYVEPNIYEDLFEGADSTGIQQKSSTPLNYYGLIVELMGKNKKSDYSLEFTSKVDIDKLDSDFNFYNESAIDSMSNNTSYKKTEFSLSGKYNFSITNKFKLGSKFKLAKNLLTLNETNKNLFSFQPSIFLNYKKTGLGSFGLTFSYNNSLPTIQYLSENYILKNYRTFTKGNNDPIQLGNYNISFIYTFSNFEKQFLINSFMIYSVSNESYGLRSNVDESNNFNQYEMTDGNRMIHYNLNISKYLSPISCSFKLSTQQMWSYTPLIVNNIVGVNKNYNSSYRMQGTTYFKAPVNFKLAAEYNYLRGVFNNNISKADYLEWFIDCDIKFSKEWVFKSENSYYSINDNNYFFSDISVNYTPQKGRFSYWLIGNNLWNIKTFSNTTISEYQRNENKFRIIPRYFLLSVKYRF